MNYLKIKVENITLQTGGTKDEEELVKNIFLNGNTFYYSNKGKLLVNSGNAKKARDEVFNIVLKKIKKFNKKNIILISLNDWETNNYAPARIGISIYILEVSLVNNNKLAFPIRNKINSSIRIFLKPEEYDFKFIKKCTKLVLDKKLKDINKYTYDDLKKLMKN